MFLGLEQRRQLQLNCCNDGNSMRTISYIIQNFIGLQDCISLVLVAGIAYLVAWRKTGRKKASLIWTLLAAYVLFVLFITLINRMPAATIRFELIPLSSWFEVVKYQDEELLIQVLLNIVLFIPIGSLLELICIARDKGEKHSYLQVLVPFLFSAAIEVLQLVTRRGMFEWDDMLHNTLGAIIGMCIVVSWNKLRQSRA